MTNKAIGIVIVFLIVFGMMWVLLNNPHRYSPSELLEREVKSCNKRATWSSVDNFPIVCRKYFPQYYNN